MTPTWEEEFDTRFVIVRARGNGESKFRPVIYADNEQQENTDKIKSFIRSIRKEAIKETVERMVGVERGFGEDVTNIEDYTSEDAYRSGRGDADFQWKKSLREKGEEIIKNEGV